MERKQRTLVMWGGGLVLAAAGGLLLWTRACAGDSAGIVDNSDAAAGLRGEGIVLAYVGERRQPVTAYDVEFATKQTLGKLADVVLEGKARIEVAESIISSRALAQLREAEMSATERAELAKHVQAHRERLLVKSYLDAHTKPEPTSEDELLAYYTSNQAKFGARDEKKFELVFVELGADRSVHPELLKGLAALAQAQDWRSMVAARQTEGLPFGYRVGDVELASLPGDLRTAAMKLQAKEQTNVITQGGKAYLLRVNEISRKEARPFAEVKAQIAEILEPRATKRRLQSVAAQATKQVTIERTPALLGK